MKKPARFLNLEKPRGMTSRDVVDKVVDLVGDRHVGHAGTLDPAATGVLVVAVGLATRLIEYVQRMKKTYQAEFLLGQTSDTDDAEGRVSIREDCRKPSPEEVAQALASMVGTLEQRPPAYSAIKVAGKRAYKRARSGEAVVLAPRPVVIHRISVAEYAFPRVSVEIECGGGVYIRSIARDLGEKLGTGGLMARLVRTSIGVFTLAEATPLEHLQSSNWLGLSKPLDHGLVELPRRQLSSEDRERFHFGQAIQVVGSAIPKGEIAVYGPNDEFLGIGIGEPKKRRLRPSKGGFDQVVSMNGAEEAGPAST